MIQMTVTSTWTTTPWLRANFVFVARDPVTKGPKSIPPLLTETEEENITFQKFEKIQQKLKTNRKQKTNNESHLSSFGLEQSSDTMVQMASKLLSDATPYLILPSLTHANEIFISATKMTNTVICQPQYRNIHNKVFGGFLLKQAFELAFVNAYQFLGTQPVFREVDRVLFRHPVEIGDILRLDSCIIWTTPRGEKNPNTGNHSPAHPMVHVEVIANVISPELQTLKVTNVFHFTFEARNCEVVKSMLPTNIEEAMRVAHFIELNHFQDNDGGNVSGGGESGSGSGSETGGKSVSESEN
jgi:acyl-coenzyme A thioesterase 9